MVEVRTLKHNIKPCNDKARLSNLQVTILFHKELSSCNVIVHNKYLPNYKIST